MIHEIKTPLNAIIGFAEIIDGQYFGPAHSRYRERAAEIVANARSLLEAAEDLDFAARLQSARARPGEGTEMSAFLPAFAETLQARAARHGVAIDMNAALGLGRSALDPELMERLLRRFTDAVLSATASGEQLKLNVRPAGKALAFDITRPGATMMAGKEELLDPEFTIGDADRALLGLGFSLRLVNGLVGIAGGSLEIGESQFTLSVPLAKA
nr:histidine kinase dimerization/phospho-acceptor domain-containing protein [Sphingomonas alba]